MDQNINQKSQRTNQLTFRSSFHCCTSPGGTTIRVAPDLPSPIFRLARADFDPLRIRAIVTTVLPKTVATKWSVRVRQYTYIYIIVHISIMQMSSYINSPLPMASPSTPPRSGDFFDALAIKHQPMPGSMCSERSSSEN
jgi:hypothetical protein